MAVVSKKSRRRFSKAVIAVLLTVATISMLAPVVLASGPRWVKGAPYFTGWLGIPVVWYTPQPFYFTDPGDLSASVNHAAADAIVAAAAGVWNVPTANIQLTYGGMLNEHVSGANTYLGSNGPVFPADVQSSNYAAKQIAVIYDSDGSVTDTLLGGGASNPAECLQNGVTESVDSIVPEGYIEHALLILNGRCTGPAPEQQLQMQYQLERAFGRVLGLAWSQTNDNVFTRTPTPTYVQAQHWPIMHPIDIVCGVYTYQCLPQPFTLRDDDIAGITSLYLIGYSHMMGRLGFSNTLPGKAQSYDRAADAYGNITFPTGQGMNGVNVVVQRRLMFFDVPEAFQEASSVSGFLAQQNGGNPVTGPGTGIAASLGAPDDSVQGYYDLAWIPMIDASQSWVDALITTEPVNPLYMGTHAVGPYASGAVHPSGSPMTSFTTGLYPNDPGYNAMNISMMAKDASNSCSPGNDGTETAPQQVASGGWWTGLLCAHGHTSWAAFTAKAGRTATVEVTALDESGLATTAKAMPMIGVWGAADAVGTLPTVSLTPSAFNTVTLGMTATSLSTQAQSYRVAIADARGEGRPDFAYRARVLYADTVQPASTSLAGGQITISGLGFRAGNVVKVNGVEAVVSSWSASTIVAVAPPVSALAKNPTAAVDVSVTDLSTGGTTTMTGALTYGGIAADQIVLVSAPSGTVLVGAAASTPFAVRVLLGDGVTPVAGVPVTFSASGAAAQFGACASGACAVVTDSTGLASTSVTATAFGTVTMQATAAGATLTTTFQAVARSVAAVRAFEYVAAGAVVAWTPQVNVMEDGAPAAGIAMAWTASGALLLFSSSSTVSASGSAQVAATIGPLAAGVQASGQACAWSGTQCASFAAMGVAASDWRLTVANGAGQSVANGATFAPVTVMVTDVAGHPVAGVPVAIHQTMDAAEMPCPDRGQCPVAPELGSSEATGVSDANGMVSVTPMQQAGVGEVTNIAVAAGTQGFVSFSLSAN